MRVVVWVSYYCGVLFEYAKKSGGLEKKWTLELRNTDSPFKGALDKYSTYLENFKINQYQTF